jgi:putative transcriptional regulator
MIFAIPFTLASIDSNPPSSSMILKTSVWVCLPIAFNDVVSLLQSGAYDINKIKFFVGYSGWGANQLQEEMNEKSWLVAQADSKIIFETSCELVWKESVKKLGKDYQEIINYPIDPQLN